MSSFGGKFNMFILNDIESPLGHLLSSPKRKVEVPVILFQHDCDRYHTTLKVSLSATVKGGENEELPKF